MPVPAPVTKPPHVWRDALLVALRERGGIVREACRAAGIGKSVVYETMRSDPDLRAAVDAARAEGIDDGVDRAETELLRRGLDHDTTALLAYLNAHATDRGYYRHSRVQVSGPDGGPIAVGVASGLDDEERLMLRDLVRAEIARRVTVVPEDGG